jgi:triacylglycerol esterase/lipase EstA (alpha/beta hydrolase family)
MIAGGYVAVLVIEFAWVRASYDRHDPLRPRLSQLLSACVVEALTAPRVFAWRQPFRSRRQPDQVDDVCGRRGLVLVHGFFCNRGLWNPWLERLRREGVPFVALNLEPIFGGIDDYGPTIDDGVKRLHAATGVAPVVVAHSMGGLAVRAWLAGTDCARIHRLITIASPHAGTRMATRGHGHNVAQMRPDSDWLAQLAAREDGRARERFVCFWSHCDNIVFPTRNATLPGADNRHLEATPHVAMVYHPEVFAAAQAALAG